MTDAIISGADGFIGRLLADKLEHLGQKIIKLTRANGDISDPATWQKLPAAATVFHLAGRSYVPQSWEQPEEFIRTNVGGTQCALNYCKNNGAKIVFASAYVYGIPARMPISEQDVAHPNNPYALSKLLAEQLCEFAAEYQNIPATILRIFNIYGKGQRPEFLIPIILDHIKKNEPIKLQTLTPRRDYVYIEDVLDAFLQAQKTPAGLQKFNIGSGISYSVKEIIDIIQSETGTNLSVISAGIERAQEIPDVIADIAMAGKTLDWKPKYSLNEGIKDILNHSKGEIQ